jgi:hypothetical protein
MNPGHTTSIKFYLNERGVFNYTLDILRSGSSDINPFLSFPVIWYDIAHDFQSKFDPDLPVMINNTKQTTSKKI